MWKSCKIHRGWLFSERMIIIPPMWCPISSVQNHCSLMIGDCTKPNLNLGILKVHELEIPFLTRVINGMTAWAHLVNQYIYIYITYYLTYYNIIYICDYIINNFYFYMLLCTTFLFHSLSSEVSVALGSLCPATSSRRLAEEATEVAAMTFVGRTQLGWDGDIIWNVYIYTQCM